MITQAQREAWDRDGYFFVRGAIDPAFASAVEDEVVGRIRADPPAAHPGQQTYSSGENYLIYPETEPSPGAVNPEDLVSKVFNCHAEGLSRELAERPEIADVVAGLLGPDVDCFQSQFIFKNPGVIGQPWHQDSYYFKFDKQPQCFDLDDLLQQDSGEIQLWERTPGSLEIDHFGQVRRHAGGGDHLRDALASK